VEKLHIVVSRLEDGDLNAFLSYRPTMTLDEAQGEYFGVNSSERAVGIYEIKMRDDDEGQVKRQLLWSTLDALMKLNLISRNHEIEDVLARLFLEGFRAGIDYVINPPGKSIGSPSSHLRLDLVNQQEEGQGGMSNH